MQLSMGDGRVIDDPTDRQIVKVLEALDGNEDSFAILSAPDGTFVQCAGDRKTGFLLEYKRAGHNLYRAANAPVSLHMVTTVFQQFAGGRADCKSHVVWQERERGTISEYWNIPAEQRERLVEIHKGHIVIGRKWFCYSLALLLLAAAVLSVFGGGLRGSGLFVGLAALLFVIGHRSDAEKRGYRF